MVKISGGKNRNVSITWINNQIFVLNSFFEASACAFPFLSRFLFQALSSEDLRTPAPLPARTRLEAGEGAGAPGRWRRRPCLLELDSRPARAPAPLPARTRLEVGDGAGAPGRGRLHPRRLEFDSRPAMAPALPGEGSGTPGFIQQPDAVPRRSPPDR